MSIVACPPFTNCNGALFAKTYSGILLSTSNGSDWISINPGIPGDYFISLALVGSDLFAGTIRSGVWRRPIAELIPLNAVEPNRRLAAAESIASYPNPLSSATTIQFTTEQRGPAQVSILNLLGEEVASLFSGELEAGEHAFMWDAKGVTAGMYWCVIRSNDGNRVQRVPMMVVH